MVDEQGVALAAIQGLYGEVQARDARIASQDARLVEQGAQLASQAARVAVLEQRTGIAATPGFPELPLGCAAADAVGGGWTRRRIGAKCDDPPAPRLLTVAT